MPDEIDRVAKGIWDVATGLATMDVIKIVEAAATVLGLETNASALQKYMAVEFEDFAFNKLRELAGESAQQKGRLDTYEQRLLKLSWAMDEYERRLGEQGATRSDLGAVLEASFKVWKANADARKRKLLGNALLNAFDPKQYEEGQTLRLLEILAQLNYGDIQKLRDFKEQLDALPKDGNGRLLLTNHLMGESRAQRLKVPLRAEDVRPSSMLADHIKRLSYHGLVIVDAPTVRLDGENPLHTLKLNLVTDLGASLLALTADPGPSPDASPVPPA